MSHSLIPELEAIVTRKVRSGLYSSADEVLREALRLLEDRDKLREIRLEELRQEIAIGIEQADQGKVAPLDLDAIWAQVTEHLEQKESRS